MQGVYYEQVVLGQFVLDEEEEPSQWWFWSGSAWIISACLCLLHQGLRAGPLGGSPVGQKELVFEARCHLAY